jgi:hypothetical protein
MGLYLMRRDAVLSLRIVFRDRNIVFDFLDFILSLGILSRPSLITCSRFVGTLVVNVITDGQLFSQLHRPPCNPHSSNEQTEEI